MKVATLEMDFVTNLARLQGELTTIKRNIGQTMGEAVLQNRMAERAAESAAAKFAQEAAAIGKTAIEIRKMDIAAKALAADEAGFTTLAASIRASGTAITAAAEAAQRAAAEEARLATEARAAAEAQAVLARASASAAKERQEAIAAADRYAAKLESEVGAIGRTAAELRQLEIASRAVAAEQAGMPDIAARMRAAGAAMAQTETQAAALAAQEKRLADEHERLAAKVRASRAEQEADQASLQALRRSIDPTAAAQDRLNAEIAEAGRLYRAGVTGAAEYGQQQRVLAQRIEEVKRAQLAHIGAMDGVSPMSRRASAGLANLSFQLNDIGVGLASGQKPMMVFVQQGAQILQIAQMAEGGIKGFALQIGKLALAWWPLIAAAAAAGVALHAWQKSLNSQAGLKAYADTLGLTHKEMKKLGDVSVTVGDMLGGMWKTVTNAFAENGRGKKLLDFLVSPADIAMFKNLLALAVNVVRGITAAIYGLFVGGYTALMATWRQFPAALSDLFVKGVNGAIAAVERLLNGSIDALNALARGGNSVLKAAGFTEAFGQISHAELGRIQNNFAGAAAAVGKTWSSSLNSAVKQGLDAPGHVIAAASKNILQASRDRLAAKAKDIIGDRTPKTDTHGASLAREAEATEAQIRNLYALSAAYRESGAAALIAEAREKAESQAIKQRGDIEAAVDRQIRLTIAQRIADAQKSAAATRDQAAAQEAVNAQVAAGLIPAVQAADAVRDQIALLPLLTAQQVAQQRGLVKEAAAATQAIDDQTAAQDRARKATIAAQALQDCASAGNQIAQLQEELRLIGATDAARAHALAVLRATQEAAAKQYNPAQAATYIADQVRIADLTQANQQATEDYNAALTLQGDLLAEIDQNAQRAAQGMADAFGDVGRAIGDVATTLTGYYGAQARMQEQHAAALRKAGTDEAAIARENLLFATASAGQQIHLYGDIAGAARGFFKEGSKGYKALTVAEQGFRAVEMALAIANAAEKIGLFGATAVAKVATDTVMAASDTTRAGIEQSNSIATTAIKGVEAVVNAIRSLPFPADIAAGAAVAAVIGSLGVQIAGGFGGGGNTLPKANEGTGTVFGDSSAQSESLQRSIDLLGDVETVTMRYSAQMAASLKSIETSIGGLTNLLIRAGDINASADVSTGFKSDAIGSALSAIPLIGGLLGSLFGSKTKVIGSGIYGSAQSVGSILDSGFDASYYSDVEKKKKFLGLTTSTKYSTSYTGADDEIEAQFGQILKQFYTTIAAAAPPLGQATGDVEDRLKGFVVDLGKIDLQGLSGTEIADKLSAVFGAAADDMAHAAIPGLEKFQAVGEGYFETLARVASTVEAVTSSLGQLGLGAQSLGVDASMAIAGLFGSVGDMTSAADAYFATYYSEAEQTAAKTAQLASVFTSIGAGMPDSIAGFRQLVEAQDLTTDAGRSTYAQLLKIAPAFAELTSTMQDATSAAAIVRERESLQQKLLELQGDTVALRAAELSRLDPSNRALQQRIYDLTDEQAATEAAAQAAADLAQQEQAIANERAGLERQLLQARGDTAALRALELAGLDASNRAIQQQIYDLADLAAATDAAAKAAADAAAVQQAIANERAGLDKQLLQLQGDTLALRRLELAALDPANRALQQQIYDLQDFQAATAAAAQAATEAAAVQAQAAADLAARQAAIAGERDGLERQLLDLQGQTVAIRTLDLAKLDASNRALQEHVWALQDEAAATTAAAQAAAAAAAQEQAIAGERAGLQQQLYQLLGDTASLRAMELAKLDPSNRALQDRIYRLQDEQANTQAAAQAAQQAAQAADQLRQAWASIGDGLLDEVKRIRGLGQTGSQSYASLLGQFNAATAGARAGDQDAAKSLTGLSQALLDAAADVATSQQELARVQGVTAASLETTAAMIGAGAFSASDSKAADGWWNKAAAASAPPTSTGTADLVAEVRTLRAEVAGLRNDQRSANATIAANTGKAARILDNVTAESGGNAIMTEAA